MSSTLPSTASRPLAANSNAAIEGNRQSRVDVPLKQRMQFFRQFATCIKAGLTLGAALKHLEAETSNRDLKEAARKAQICVERGGKLSAWMKTRPHVFSRAEAAFILVGETGGALEESLERIASDLEDEMNLRRRMFLATFIAKFVLLPMMLLIPSTPNIMVHGLNGLEKQPGLSVVEQQKVILREGLKGYASDTMQWALPLVLGAVFCYLLWRIFVLTPIGRRVADQLILWTPVSGTLWRDWAVCRYLQALSLLSKAGMVPAAALEACRGLAGNEVLDAKFDAAAKLAREKNLSIPEALAQTGVFNAVTMSLIRTGDHAGAMPEMLNKAASYYEADVRGRLTSVPKIYGLVVFGVCSVAAGFILYNAFTAYYANIFPSVDKYLDLH